MKNVLSFLSVCLLSAGCQFNKPVSVRLSSHDFEVLRPSLVNTLERYGILKGGCTEKAGDFHCTFTPGKSLKKVSYDYRLQKDGSWRIVILDTADFGIATSLKADIDEDLVDGKWVSQDGAITIEAGHMVNAPPCDPNKPCKPKCCKCKEPLFTLETIVVLTIREQAKPCHPCLKP